MHAFGSDIYRKINLHPWINELIFILSRHMSIFAHFMSNALLSIGHQPQPGNWRWLASIYTSNKIQTFQKRKKPLSYQTSIILCYPQIYKLLLEVMFSHGCYQNNYYSPTTFLSNKPLFTHGLGNWERLITIRQQWHFCSLANNWEST